ncbi:carbon storage regulator [Paucimonas lemoignei]|jgi:carbon storage regulator|nr:carbon storage regulator [Paucimonas lemoignei]
MLVLNREAGEAFSIGDEINLQVLAVHGNQVRIGITAPRQIKIHRAEVYKRIAQTQSKQSAELADNLP